MKLLIFYALCFFSVVFGSITLEKKKELIKDWLKMMEVHENDCIKETGITPNELRNAIMTLMYSDDKKVKCYFKCQHVHLGIFDYDNNFHLEEMIKHFSGINEDLAQWCIKKVSTYINLDPCSRIHSFMRCCVYTLFSEK
ncbi:hypothetical protein FQA39_LY16744 [Lamprigera yunnana]|nr:hypothetical protein FQA39_LY16744 [Lamprigera yunnana]